MSILQVCLAFNPQSTILVTGSMDQTAKLWDIASGTEIATLRVRGVFNSSARCLHALDRSSRVIQVKSYRLVSTRAVIK